MKSTYMELGILKTDLLESFPKAAIVPRINPKNIANSDLYSDYRSPQQTREYIDSVLNIGR